MTLPNSSPDAARKALRASLRARLRAVTPVERARAAHALARNAGRLVGLAPGTRVAVYAALPGELDATPLIELALRRGCRVYLPRIARAAHSRGMRFIEMRGALRRNRLGIAEPAGHQMLGARWLDLVFLPLVGFDRHGVRLGSGGGFYDRAFAFRRFRRGWPGPRLIGVGYAFQEVERITAATHDVLMDAVITDRGIIPCATG